MSSFELSVLFFLQLAFILTVCRIVGWLAKWAGQPQVVAEMIAGVIMGPSLLGWLFPAVQAWLFPTDVKGLRRHQMPLNCPCPLPHRREGFALCRQPGGVGTLYVFGGLGV